MTLYDDTEPYKTVAATMSRFQFTRPATEEDCAAVRSALEAAAPGASVDVLLLDEGAVSVEVRDARGLPVFGRMYFAR